MYLQDVFVAGLGPITKFEFAFRLDNEGQPIPLVLVGENGTGKSTIISVLADTLFEAAAVGFSDVLPNNNNGGRNWFRIVGGQSRQTGSSFGLAFVRLSHAEREHYFLEQSGELSLESPAIIPSSILSRLSNDGKTKKIVSVTEAESKAIFASGSYFYSPSSRSELPYWLNTSIPRTDTFSSAANFSGNLHKPIQVEHGLEPTIQWLLALLTDSRIEVTNSSGIIPQTIIAIQALNEANNVLKTILNDETAQFFWLWRLGAHKVGIFRKDKPLLPSLYSLSSGQISVLTIFLTLLRYSDNDIGKPLLSARINGICIVDEIDAHMHIDLQSRAIPALIKKFRNVQFIVSVHSPVMLLALEDGLDDVDIVECPDGRIIQAEDHSELGGVLAPLTRTSVFKQKVSDHLQAVGKMVVWTEGETDPLYLQTACQLLDPDLLHLVEFEWIGAIDDNTKTAFHTGKDALNQTLKFLRAKPDAVKRKVALLYDHDAAKKEQGYGNVAVLSLPENIENRKISAGIENLLSEDIIEERFYSTKITSKPNGDVITHKTLNKMKLCKEICVSTQDAGIFHLFTSTLQALRELADQTAVSG